MLTRREFTVSLALVTCTSLTVANSGNAEATRHPVRMLNARPGKPDTINIFDPTVLYMELGDSVTFLASDSGHNSASRRGMIPEGAEPWNGAIDEELTITLSIPGIYGYICVPHYEEGMVGLIIVGNDLSNLKAVKKIRHPGDARKKFRLLFKELEKKGNMVAHHA